MALLTHRTEYDREECLEEQQEYDMTILKRHYQNTAQAGISCSPLVTTRKIIVGF